jgi:hypothetical protein
VIAAAAPHATRWALLDPYTSRHTRGAALGLVEFRLPDARKPSVGYSLVSSEAVTTLRGAFLAGGVREFELRLVPSDSFAIAFSRYLWEAGPRLGPVEPVARVGFTSLHLDYGRAGLCFGALSPRVGAALWLRVGQSRLGLSAFVEYYWRWLGGESAFVRGVSLEIAPLAGPLVTRSTTSSPSAPARR